MSTLVSLRQLEIFLAIARAGHVTRASEALHLSQSAASMALAQLETQLETALFERDGRRLQLTERGRLLIGEAEELLSRVRALPVLLSGGGAALRGELRIASSQTVGCYLLAPVMAGFARQHPAASVRCQISNTKKALSALLDHEVDVAYVEGPVTQPELQVQAWRKDHLQIVTATEMPHPRRLTASTLGHQHWIMREPGSGTRDFFDEALRRAGLPPITPLQTMDDTEAIKEAVIAGAGMACLPRLAVDADIEHQRLTVIPAPFLSLERQLWRAARRNAFEGPLLTAFERQLSESLG